MTQQYIGTKLVTAWPQDKASDTLNPAATGEETAKEPGYAVQYPDGYTSWSPKHIFENAYIPMGGDNDGTQITASMVSDFIVDRTNQKLGRKTTVVVLILRNGFEIVGESSCVEVDNYDHDLGVRLATERAREKVWMVLGFLLQAARNGVDRTKDSD